MPAPPAEAELAAKLWPLAKKRAFSRKTLPQAEAAEALGIPVEQVPSTVWPLHVWSWVRGLPPLNVVVVQRGKTTAPEPAPDYDVVHEAMGHTVYTLEHAWHYPWEKVPDPTPEQLAWALAAHASHHGDLWEFRFLDLEMELRLRDEARGRRRPAPGKHATWNSVEMAHRDVLARLKAVGIREADLRPPGKGPYPPPRPVKGNWAD